jgi:hypothetical protein
MPVERQTLMFSPPCQQKLNVLRGRRYGRQSLSMSVVGQHLSPPCARSFTLSRLSKNGTCSVILLEYGHMRRYWCSRAPRSVQTV